MSGPGAVRERLSEKVFKLSPGHLRRLRTSYLLSIVLSPLAPLNIPSNSSIWKFITNSASESPAVVGSPSGRGTPDVAVGIWWLSLGA